MHKPRELTAAYIPKQDYFPRKVLNLSLIMQHESAKHNIEFEYRLGEDRPDKVARELVTELSLDPSAISMVTREIELLVKSELKKLDSQTIFQSASQSRKYKPDLIVSKPSKPPKVMVIETYTKSTRKSSTDSSIDSPTVQNLFLKEPASPVKSNSSIYGASGAKSTTSENEASSKHAIPCLSVILRRGNADNKRSEVETLQQALNEVLGLNAKVDGLFTRKTESFVKQFQERQGLEVDGIVTHDLWDRLMIERERLSS
mmetsp:Transcript_27176/g.48784  ORF Transcript_27176/g.48784 Transcript_27176/m.48784 type:complete len:259 (+) Transcript_27176:485-1261(+)